jgi:hypothetical protein
MKDEDIERCPRLGEGRRILSNGQSITSAWIQIDNRREISLRKLHPVRLLEYLQRSEARGALPWLDVIGR